jgi:hypothetical protein
LRYKRNIYRAFAGGPPAETKTTDDKDLIPDLISKGKQIGEISYDLIITGTGFLTRARFGLKIQK